jgi:hypothetical protein
MQDKDTFVNRATRAKAALDPVSDWSTPVVEKMDTLYRKVKSLFFRKGPKAMLENLMLAQRHCPTGRLPADAG